MTNSEDEREPLPESEVLEISVGEKIEHEDGLV